MSQELTDRMEQLKDYYKMIPIDCHNVDEAIAALRSEPVWIPVGERLPEEGVSVLVYEPGQMVQRTARDNYDWMLPHKSKITYWMPLPAAPAYHGDKHE